MKSGAIPIIVLWPFGPVRCAYELADTTGASVDDAILDRVFGEPAPIHGDLVERIANSVLAKDRIKVEPVTMALNRGGDARAVGSGSEVKDESPRWVIRVNSNLNESAQITTLAYELAHVYLGHLGGSGKKWPNRTEPGRLDVEEFEAEAVAFIVGRRFGLNTKSAEYLNGYLKDHTIDHVSHSAIARAAGRIEQHIR